MLDIRSAIALLVLTAVVIAVAASGVFGVAGHSGFTSRADDVVAPTVMVHADHPTCSRASCAWNPGVGGTVRK